MNLFVLDEDLDKGAEYHIDKHVVKMILEAAQLLNTTMWIDKFLGCIPRALSKEELSNLKEVKKEKVFPYQPTHPNHPCAIWVRTSLDNYEWTFCYAEALYSEFIYRYGTKEHKSITAIRSMPEPSNLLRKGLTTHAMAMPDIYKTNNVIDSYREYYKKEKVLLGGWKLRATPDWVN